MAATLPSRHNAQLDALRAKIAADISGSVVQRASFLPERPEDWFEAGSFPTSTRLLAVVVDGEISVIDQVGSETVVEYERGQAIAGVVRGWSVRPDGDKTRLSEQRVNDMRSVMNAIEAAGAAAPFADGYTVDWVSAGRIDTVSNQPPYAAFEVAFRVTVWE